MNATSSTAPDVRKATFVSPWANVIAGTIIAIIGLLLSGKFDDVESVILAVCGVVLALSGVSRMRQKLQQDLPSRSQAEIENE